MIHLSSRLSLALGLATAYTAAAAATVLKDASAYGFPDFLTSVNATTKGWMFAPPFVGLKWVELNGVLLIGNTGANDPETGLTFSGTPAHYVASELDWLEASQRPARNGISRGGLGGGPAPLSLRLAATPGHTYLLEILTLGGKSKRAFNVSVNGQTVAENWTIEADKAANRLLRLQVDAGAGGIELQLTPGNAAGANPAPALSALALTDLAGGVAQYDPIFGRVATGWVNISPLGTGSSPDGLPQDGDGRGSQAAIDGDPGTYWDEQDNARLYRYAVTFKQPEKICALAIMGWAQHDFAPKDFEVLCDGQSVKKLENAQYDRNILHVPLDETACQSIELKITGYYGRSPAIRELGIFSREAHPNLPKPTSAAAAPAAPAAKAEPKDGGPIFAEWPVTYKQQRLLVYALGKFKPYVKEFAPLGGKNVLRDAPFDHLHHHGLMYAIKANGVNFWEEVAGCGFQKPVATTPWTEGKSARGQPQFTLRQTLHWLAPADAALADTSGAAILIERRTLTLTVNEALREVALHWKSGFEAGPKTNQVTLTGANYHGLGVRFQQELDPLAKHRNAGGAPDLGGNRQDVSRHPWGSVSFEPAGQGTTLVVFGHPGNARGDSWFFTMRTPFAYLSATQNLDKEPLVYSRGDKFQLDYLVALYAGPQSAEALEARRAQWADTKP